jgi:hypothetical protein
MAHPDVFFPRELRREPFRMKKGSFGLLIVIRY